MADKPITPFQAVVQLLRGCAVAGFEWGENANPFYDTEPEPSGTFPRCIFTMARSSVEIMQMGGVGDSLAYTERRMVTVTVIGETEEIEQLTAPEVPGSIFSYMDAVVRQPELMDGVGFECLSFIRKSYELRMDEYMKEDSITNIWRAVAEYDYLTEAPTPTRG